MKAPEAETLRHTVDESRRELDSAFASLERVLLERVSLGRQLAEHPWWLIGACAVGLFFGVRSRQ
jgi:hypothetical protein